MSELEQLETFTLDTLPTLDIVVLGALELFGQEVLTPIQTGSGETLVLGSGNAASTGKILFAEMQTQFANETNYLAALAEASYDQVIVISASGGKHAIAMVTEALQRGFKTRLITNNPSAPAAQSLPAANVVVFPRNREPYTYNTSTYLGPILAATGESPEAIQQYLSNVVQPKLLRHFADYQAYCFIVPDEFAEICGMINTKFDELFGPMVVGRAFTTAEIMHAKTVVPSGTELFISLGEPNRHYGLSKNRLHIDLPVTARWGAVMATAYFIVGKIQAAHPPYFKNNIKRYCEQASALFGHAIQPIVE